MIDLQDSIFSRDEVFGVAYSFLFLRAASWGSVSELLAEDCKNICQRCVSSQGYNGRRGRG